MKYTVDNANRYIKENKNNVNKLYRLKYHMSPPIGWMNDPNGLTFFENKYHLFYQYYPYDSVWGPMHWGHFISNDLIKYDDLDVALAPDQEDETGCFSGGAIVDDNKINLIYTKHFEKDNLKNETIHLAKSEDGISFKKIGKLFSNDDLPKNYSRIDFRDPSPYKINNKYYIFVGGRNDLTNEGVIIVLESDKLEDFKYSFSIGPFYELGDMAECPSYHKVDGFDVIAVSGCHVKEKDNSFKNVNSSVFVVGNIDFINKKMNVLNIQEIDKGDSFYAPQFISNLEKPVMVGWMEMWGKEIPTNVLGHKWAGALSLPRILSIKDNRVYQKPISISKYLKKATSKASRSSYISAYAKGDFEITFISSNGFININGDLNSVKLDTTKTNNLYSQIRSTDHGYKEVKLDIYLDTSSIELFINDGEFVISDRIYLDHDYDVIATNNVTFTINNIDLEDD